MLIHQNISKTEDVQNHEIIGDLKRFGFSSQEYIMTHPFDYPGRGWSTVIKLSLYLLFNLLFFFKLKFPKNF